MGEVHPSHVTTALLNWVSRAYENEKSWTCLHSHLGTDEEVIPIFPHMARKYSACEAAFDFNLCHWFLFLSYPSAVEFQELDSLAFSSPNNLGHQKLVNQTIKSGLSHTCLPAYKCPLTRPKSLTLTSYLIGNKESRQLPKARINWDALPSERLMCASSNHVLQWRNEWNAISLTSSVIVNTNLHILVTAHGLWSRNPSTKVVLHIIHIIKSALFSPYIWNAKLLYIPSENGSDSIHSRSCQADT